MLQGWSEGVSVLITNGADQTIPDDHGRVPLHLAIYGKNPG